MRRIRSWLWLRPIPLPDIVTAQDNWLGQFTSSEWILPLDEYLSGQEDKFADTVTKIVWANQKEMYGNIYTVPDGMMVKGIYIRKDWCEEAGINIEDLRDWTYDDYFEVIEKLTNADKKQYGMTYRGTRGAFDVIMTYLQGFTGDVLTTRREIVSSIRMNVWKPLKNLRVCIKRGMPRKNPSTGDLWKW